MSKYQLIIDFIIKKKKLLIYLIITLTLVIIGIIRFSPMGLYLRYPQLETYISSEIIATPIISYGLGNMALTPPPESNPPIFKLDRTRTRIRRTRIDLDRIKYIDENTAGTAIHPIMITAFVNSNGYLSDLKKRQGSGNNQVDNYILERIKGWIYKANTATGRILFVIKPRAFYSEIELQEGFKVMADRIAKGPNLGNFDTRDFRSGIFATYKGKNLEQ